ncbi:DUF4037 domain-containing protein [Pararhizobium sp.]|uniref:DUF4037 domain-containing protein n=1 Tax=Pararhizobium sp. TaxID=1977563 RepID=UPI002719FBE7|nr:DUF4037 domain-containing protein [Pararhizobium sp.]MDO9417085.1 DUF4037 domain-containing protein [Pararhizobium sp.]
MNNLFFAAAPETGAVSCSSHRGPKSIEPDLFADMAPVLADLAETGAGAVSLGGSRAKKRSDSQSDYDFRVYAKAFKGPELEQTSAWGRFEEVWRLWEARGLRIDGVWWREYGSVQRKLDAWMSGTAVADPYVWTIWGYHLPTDLAHQIIITDPDGILTGWKAQLSTYPEALRKSIIAKHLPVLRYWAADYHYASKVQCGDAVFLAGLTAKLVQAILQIIFALNRTYYPGDGWNLAIADGFATLPRSFGARMAAILQPCNDSNSVQRQRAELIAIISELEVLVVE